MQAHPDAALVYGQAVLHLSNGGAAILGKAFDSDALRQANFIPNVCAMLRKSAVDQVGSFDPHVILKRRCDWDLWIRVSKRFPVLFINDEIADEYGLSRSDSIGHTFTHIPNIVSKYMQHDRDSLLRLETLDSYDPFNINPFDMYSSEEQNQIQFLVVEHFIKTVNLQGLRSVDYPAKPELLSQLHVNNPSLSDETALKIACHLIHYYEQKADMTKLENVTLYALAEERRQLLLDAIKNPIIMVVFKVYRTIRRLTGTKSKLS